MMPGTSIADLIVVVITADVRQLSSLELSRVIRPVVYIKVRRQYKVASEMYIEAGTVG
jgi:hypothetical protein